MVADRAGVSRGAQSYHFATKHELVVAAIEHLFERHASGFVEAFASIPEQQRTLGRAVGELWAIVDSPAYAATLEVVVAARTDDQLRIVVHGVALALERTVVGLLGELFPDLGVDEIARPLVGLAFAVVQGAAISGYAGFGDPHEVVAGLRHLADVLSPDTLALVIPSGAHRTGEL